MEIPVELLSRLGESEELKALLQNPHLRTFLQHVNSTHNPHGFMKVAMREPIFVEFADACLKVIHPGMNYLFNLNYLLDVLFCCCAF